MKTQPSLWSKPAGTPKIGSAERHAHDRGNGVVTGPEEPALVPGALDTESDVSSGRLPWPRALRVLLVTGGLFWLVIGLLLWVYFSN